MRVARALGLTMLTACAHAVSAPPPPSLDVKQLEGVDLPTVTSGRPVPTDPLPIVVVRGGKIYRDGELVADGDAVAQGGKVTRIDSLFVPQKRPGTMLLAFEKKTPSVVFESVMQTVRFAGFTTLIFAARGPDGALSQLVFTPLGLKPEPPEPRFFVDVHRQNVTVVWQDATKVLSERATLPVADLASRVPTEWAQHGSRKGGPIHDQAVLYLASDVDYGELASVVDIFDSVPIPLFTVRLGIGEMGNGFGVLSGRSLREGPAQVTGPVPPAEVIAVIRRNLGRFRVCYEKALETVPDLRGLVRTRVVIDREGQVTSVADGGGSTLENADFVACVRDGFRAIPFPAPNTDEEIVVYAITFSPN